jgi:hypothetical protein
MSSMSRCTPPLRISSSAHEVGGPYDTSSDEGRAWSLLGGSGSRAGDQPRSHISFSLKRDMESSSHPPTRSQLADRASTTPELG